MDTMVSWEKLQEKTGGMGMAAVDPVETVRYTYRAD